MESIKRGYGGYSPLYMRALVSKDAITVTFVGILCKKFLLLFKMSFKLPRSKDRESVATCLTDSSNTAKLWIPHLLPETAPSYVLANIVISKDLFSHSSVEQQFHVSAARMCLLAVSDID